MGKSKRKKAPGNDVTALQTVASQQQQQQQQQLPKAPVNADSTSSTPGQGELGSPWSQQLMGKAHHRATGNSASHHHLPTITRGPQALRQMHHYGSSPLQRTPANQPAVAKIEFLSQIATWAASNKIPALGAFYGERLASACQTAGIPSPVLNSQCERCESVLLPGVNYYVRSRSKKRKKKPWSKGSAGQAIATVNGSNTVVHRCSYCKYGNQKLGTLKDDVKTKLADAAARAQIASSSPSTTADPTTPRHRQGLLTARAEGSLPIPVTPDASETVALSPANELQVDLSASSSYKKRKRKGWTGLKATTTSLQSRESPNPERIGFN